MVEMTSRWVRLSIADAPADALPMPRQAVASQAPPQPPKSSSSRRGVASLDYVLVAGVVLPMAAFVLWIGPRIIQQVYDMIAGQIGWPFM